jgi:tRNA (guanine6-N2)-methyltransferase
MANYLLSVVPGLSDIAGVELKSRFGVSPKRVTRLRTAELLEFAYKGDAKRFLGMRTTEDVFVSVGRLKLTGQESDLAAVRASAIWSAPLREALAVWSQTKGGPPLKRQEFRVVAQAEDAQWRHYRRNEIMLAAEKALLRTGPNWKLNRDVAPLEIWLQQSERDLLVSVRLSDGGMRQHGGRAEERAAALRPSVAAAMIVLTDPQADDVFLDPMCGTGTILLERAVAGRYQLLIGGDIEQSAVHATLTNFGPRHKPRRIERMDATKLPLEDASVNKIACNLPWGRQISEQAALPSMYAGMLREAGRVLMPGGRMVLLTSEWDLLKRAIKDRPELRLVRTVSNLEILGRRADMFVLERV